MSWVKIAETQDRFKGELMAAKLREQSINCQLIDKKDSMYVMLGQVEVYVQSKDESDARRILDSFNKEQND